MTNNIEKLYKLAKVEKKRKYFIKDKIKGCYFVTYKDGVIKHFNNSVPSKRNKVVRVVTYYEKFNSKKQLELILFICDNSKRDYYAYFSCDKDEIDNLYYLNFVKNEEKCSKNKTIKNIDFSQALAGLVCKLWEDLTDEQREEIKRLLE